MEKKEEVEIILKVKNALMETIEKEFNELIDKYPPLKKKDAYCLMMDSILTFYLHFLKGIDKDYPGFLDKPAIIKEMPIVLKKFLMN